MKKINNIKNDVKYLFYLVENKYGIEFHKNDIIYLNFEYYYIRLNHKKEIYDIDFVKKDKSMKKLFKGISEILSEPDITKFKFKDGTHLTINNDEV